MDRSIDRQLAQSNRAFQSGNWRSTGATAPPPRAPYSHVQDSIISPVPARFKYSRNYFGDISNPENIGADIPEEASCSLFIKNLPPDCTMNMLLGAIRNTGKIFQASTIAPDTEHVTTAAKVVFWDPAGADLFLAQVDRGEFIVGDYVPSVKKNLIRVAAHDPMKASRVFQIQGPSKIINREYLERYFEKHFSYELDDAKVMFHREELGITRIEFRFSSYRAQAAAAWKWAAMAKEGRIEAVGDMERDEIDLWGLIDIYWGRDPCAAGPRTTLQGHPRQDVAEQGIAHPDVPRPGLSQPGVPQLEVPKSNIYKIDASESYMPDPEAP
ncbi:hypothetical protein F4779DRAFT_617407 [Xylariaceae sp. FL0662B]|nr:hypothetical protein F4779DRAFT_617407 [Xylariaceae sp. FL0662B]